MSKSKEQIQKLDIFSSPFQFNLDTDQKQKKTFYGGIMSLGVLLLSFAYLIYLCYLYFSNRIQPSIAITNVDDASSYFMGVDSNLIAASVTLANGQTLYEYQSTSGKVYLQLLSALNVNGTKNKITFHPLIPCVDPNLEGYMCLDLKSLGGDISNYQLQYSPQNNLQYNIHVMFAYCQQQYLSSGQTCASPTETNALLLNYSTQAQLKLNMTQYNPKSLQYETRVKQESFFFDSTIVFYTRFLLQKYDVSINEGFIIQRQSGNTFFGDYGRVDSFSSSSFVASQLGMSILGATYFCISQESTNIVYQFPPFTSVFAQFTSILNTLLSLGFLCRLLATTEIFHQVIDLQLKGYYLRTRLFLMEYYGDKKEMKRAKEEGPFGLWKYAQNIDIKNQVCDKMNVNFLTRAKVLLFGIDKEEKLKTKKCDEKLILASLHDISDQAINVFNLQKELQEIKMMLKLVLSVEQYAAIKLCGSRVPTFIDQYRKQQSKRDSLNEEELLKQNQISNPNTIEIEQVHLNSDLKIPATQTEQQKKYIPQKGDDLVLNHIEQIDLIERDLEYFKMCVDKYLDGPLRNSEIDKRIADCMIGTNLAANNICAKEQTV